MTLDPDIERANQAVRDLQSKLLAGEITRQDYDVALGLASPPPATPAVHPFVAVARAKSASAAQAREFLELALGQDVSSLTDDEVLAGEAQIRAEVDARNTPDPAVEAELNANIEAAKQADEVRQNSRFQSNLGSFQDLLDIQKKGGGDDVN